MRFSVSTIYASLPVFKPPVDLETAVAPVPLAAVTLTQRRKVVPISTEQELEDPESSVTADSEKDNPQTGTTVSSSVVIVAPSTSECVMTADIESDEDEIFRRIAKNSS